MRASRFLPALAAGSLLLAACGGGSTGGGTAATSGPAAEAPSAPDVPLSDVPLSDVAADDATPAAEIAAAPASLQFTAPLVGGGELDAATFAGKPTLFWFWAPT